MHAIQRTPMQPSVRTIPALACRRVTAPACAPDCWPVTAGPGLAGRAGQQSGGRRALYPSPAADRTSAACSLPQVGIADRLTPVAVSTVGPLPARCRRTYGRSSHAGASDGPTVESGSIDSIAAMDAALRRTARPGGAHEKTAKPGGAGPAADVPG